MEHLRTRMIPESLSFEVSKQNIKSSGNQTKLLTVTCSNLILFTLYLGNVQCVYATPRLCLLLRLRESVWGMKFRWMALCNSWKLFLLDCNSIEISICRCIGRRFEQCLAHSRNALVR